MPPCAHSPVVPPLRLRQASLADGPQLARLATQLGYPSTEEQMARRLTALLPRADHWLGVAEAGEPGQVVAWLHASLVCALESDPHAEILGLVVDEQCRGQGIGQQLVTAASHWARGQGMERLWVRSNLVRQQAHHFYRRLGFTDLKAQQVFGLRLNEAGSAA
ncbi:GNAT family N-acetyltransferase [Pseudaeromonas paramecii]|uniref:GNAT family N-acetyltransferase n=1 Tax=Pseudaeromonas paramecii TaxID=2138166 RepID=A0ABP8Q721_9GAMM